MTKKNAKKTATRERQEKFGGSYSHHYNLSAKKGARAPADVPPVTIEGLLAFVKQHAADVLRRDDADPSGAIVVGVDAADRLGALIVVARWMRSDGLSEQVSWSRLHAVAKERHAEGQPAILAGAMPLDALAEVLREATAPDSVAGVIEAIARFASSPPPNHVHALVVGAGSVVATFARSAPTCWCGHPVSMHNESGVCTWQGEVPVTDQMRALVAASAPPPVGPVTEVKTVWQRCPCAGGPTLLPAVGAS